jgi:hypothetical protein
VMCYVILEANRWRVRLLYCSVMHAQDTACAASHFEDIQALESVAAQKLCGWLHAEDVQGILSRLEWS